MKKNSVTDFRCKALVLSLVFLLLFNTLFMPLCLANSDNKDAENPQGYGKYTFSDPSGLTETHLFDLSPTESWSVSDGMLNYLSEDLSITALAVLNKNPLDDYSAETSAFISSNGNSASVLTRVSADLSTFYQFKIDLNDGLILSKSERDNTKKLTSLSASEAYLRGFALAPNKKYSLKIQLYKGNIECFLNGVLIMEYTDKTPLAAGRTALSASGETSFEYISVNSSKVIKSIKITDIDGNPAKVVKAPIGNTPDIKHLLLKINYADGSEESVPLDTAEIGDFNFSKPGKKSVNVKYKNKLTNLKYEIINRTSDALNLNKMISNLNVDNISLDKKDVIRKLSVKYNDLTASEKKNISKENIQKLYKAQEIVESLAYPELRNSEIVYVDDFNSDDSINNYATGVDSTFDRNSGYWYTENGNLVQYCPYDEYRSGQLSARAIIKDKNWEIKSVSADVQVIDPNIFLGINACFGDGDFYEFLITDKTSVGGGNRIQLYRGTTMLKGIVETDSSKWFKPGVWYNLKMVLDNGHIKCYIDDELKLDVIDDSNSAEPLTTGTAGVRVSEGWGKFDNLIVRGKETGNSPDSVQKPILPVSTYQDNFDDEGDATNPSHWIENNREDNWQLKSENGNKFYGSSNTELGTSQSWLHVFEQDVDYSAKIRATQFGPFPVLGLYARVNTDHSYVKGGYDFTRQKWFIKVRLGYDFDETVVYSDKMSDFDLNKWYNIRLTAIDKKICLYVNNMTTPLITADAGKKVMPGRVGVFTERCNIDVDDVSLKLLSGQGRVEDGVLEYTPTDTFGVHFSFAELPDGRFIFFVYSKINASTDNGQTMQPTKEFPPEFSTSTMVRLSDEKYLYVKNCVDAFLSTDGCKTWEAVGKLPIDSNYKYAQPQDRINLVTLDDGTLRVFHTVGKQINKDGRSVLSETYYTDDCGYTWTRSETLPEEFTNLPYFCETQIIKIKNGPLVQYCSYNSGGCMRYTLSYDNGVTWEGEYALPQIPCSLGSFSVKEDPYEPGTYYMSTLYNPPYNIGNSRPRHRIALLRSYDGLTWEFLADIDRWGDVSDGARTEIMQNVNMSLGITKDYIFPLFARSEQYKKDSSGHNLQIQRVYRFEKSKLTPYSVWPQEYQINPKSITHIEPLPAVTQYAVNSKFDVDANQVRIHYFDGSTELIDMKDTTYTIPDLTSLGDKKVTVDYKKFRATYKVSVVEEQVHPIAEDSNISDTNISVISNVSNSTLIEPKTVSATEKQNDVLPISNKGTVEMRGDGSPKFKLNTPASEIAKKDSESTKKDDVKKDDLSKSDEDNEVVSTFAEDKKTVQKTQPEKDIAEDQSENQKSLPLISLVSTALIIVVLLTVWIISKKRK